MDALPNYHQPPSHRWLRLLFLTTGFIIASMCLWAFVQKQTGRNNSTTAIAPPAGGDSASRREAARVLQLSYEEPQGAWPAESPAREAMQSKRHVQEAAAWSEDSAWSGTATTAMRQASFEPEVNPQGEMHSQVRVSKPMLDEAGHYLPLPVLTAPTANAYEADPLSNAAYTANILELPVEGEFPPHEGADLAFEETVTSRPAPLQRESILTEADDSFWNIAERVYGDPRYYLALFEHNRSWIAYPDRLEPGFQVMTPPVEKLRELYPRHCPEVGR